MNEVCKASLLLDQKLVERYGSILDAEPKLLVQAYRNLKNKSQKIGQDKLHQDPNAGQFDSLFEDLYAIFKFLANQNRKNTKEINFLKTILDLLQDRKSIRTCLLDVAEEFNKIEAMVSKKYQESATDFVQFDNKFTKLKLELVESHLKKEKERNERLQMHLAFAIVDPKTISEKMDPITLLQLHQQIEKKTLHFDQTTLSNLEKELTALNPYFYENKSAEVSQPKCMSFNISKGLSSPVVQPEKSKKLSKPNHKLQETASHSHLTKNQADYSFSSKLQSGLIEKSSSMPENTLRQRTVSKVKSQAKKLASITSDKHDKSTAASIETYRFLINSERDIDERSFKKKPVKYATKVYSINPHADLKKWEPLSTSRKSGLLTSRQQARSVARMTARNLETSQKLHSETAQKANRKARSVDSQRIESPRKIQALFSESELEVFRKSAEQFQTPRPKSRDSSSMQISNRSPLKLNSQEIARIKEESKELAHFHSFNNPLKLLHEKLDELNTNAEKVLKDKGNMNIPSGRPSALTDEKLYSKAPQSMTDYQIEQLEDENDRLYKILFKEKSNNEQPSYLSFGSIDIEPRSQLMHPQPSKYDPDLSITESMIIANTENLGHSNRSSTHASTKNLLSQLNAKALPTPPIQKVAGLLELHLNRIEEIDSNSTSLKQTCRGDKAMISPSFGCEARFDGSAAETQGVIKASKSKLSKKSQKELEEVFTFTKSKLRLPRS